MLHFKGPLRLFDPVCNPLHIHYSSTSLALSTFFCLLKSRSFPCYAGKPCQETPNSSLATSVSSFRFEVNVHSPKAALASQIHKAAGAFHCFETPLYQSYSCLFPVPMSLESSPSLNPASPIRRHAKESLPLFLQAREIGMWPNYDVLWTPVLGFTGRQILVDIL